MSARRLSHHVDDDTVPGTTRLGRGAVPALGETLGVGREPVSPNKVPAAGDEHVGMVLA